MKITLTEEEANTLYTLVTTFWGDEDEATGAFQRNCESIRRKLESKKAVSR